MIFTGVQQQVPQFLAAMDVFVFPSMHEGLGLALLEAQAAGLPCVVSDSVPERGRCCAGPGAPVAARLRVRPVG